MNGSVRKSKIQVTQRSLDKYNHYQATPPKFRTNDSNNQCVYTQSSRPSSKYQTLSHKTNPSYLNFPQRDSSVKKKIINLEIDTEMINKQHDLSRSPSLKKTIGTTPLFASQDSVVLLQRIQEKRKNPPVSYDNLIDVVKLSYQNDENKINLSNDFFQMKQNKHNHSLDKQKKYDIQVPAKKIIKNIQKQIKLLKSEIGNNLKLTQISGLLYDILQQIPNQNPSQSKYNTKVSISQNNEIQNSVIPKDFLDQGYNWFSKQKKQNNAQKYIEQNQRIKTTIDERQARQRSISHKNKSPLREIINYVNKKK